MRRSRRRITSGSSELDLSAIPILDQHCHSLLRDAAAATPAAYARFFTESGEPAMHEHHVAETVFYRWAVRELAAVFACAPTTAALLGAREKDTPNTLAGRLLRDANIATLLVDYGYQTEATWSHTELAARLPCRVLPVLRLEVLAQTLILAHETFDDAIDAFVSTVDGVRAAGYVALKSVVAYRTGLAVRRTTRAEAVAAFGPVKEQARRAGGLRLASKPLKDQGLPLAPRRAHPQGLPGPVPTG